jgi:exopolysaccharide production protein ExoQ
MVLIGTVVYLVGIAGLFWLNADDKKKSSNALWLPVMWLLISGSRPLSSWLGARAGGGIQAGDEGSLFDRIVNIGLIVASVSVVVQRRAVVARFLRANAPILLFIFYCVVSIGWSDDSVVAFKRWMKLVGDFSMVLIVLTDPDRVTASKRVMARVGFLLIPLSVMLIKYYPGLARYYSPWEGTQMVSGVATDKNMLGMTCLVFGLGVWWLFLVAYQETKGWERMRRMLACGAVLVMVYWLFTEANSMTSLSCFVMAGGLLTAVTLFRMLRKPALVHLQVVTVVALSFSVLFLHISAGALETLGRNPTLTGRTEIWEALLHISGNSFLGTGFESFWAPDRLPMIWARDGLLYGLNEAHNGYLETYLNLGWVGVALLALLLVTGYRNVLLSLRRDPEIGKLKLAFFVAAVVYGLTEAAFRTTCLAWIAFLLATTAVPQTLIVRRTLPLNFGLVDADSEGGTSPRSRQGKRSVRC